MIKEISILYFDKLASGKFQLFSGRQDHDDILPILHTELLQDIFLKPETLLSLMRKFPNASGD
jgi:hypothetical protein